MSTNRYTAAMLGQLVGVHASRIRAWQRRGWIVPVDEHTAKIGLGVSKPGHLPLAKKVFLGRLELLLMVMASRER